jgi:hypothetical protein
MALAANAENFLENISVSSLEHRRFGRFAAR